MQHSRTIADYGQTRITAKVEKAFAASREEVAKAIEDFVEALAKRRMMILREMRTAGNHLSDGSAIVSGFGQGKGRYGH